MLRLEPATAGDELFLYELYAESRREELSALAWDGAQQHAFLRMQFDTQQRSYRAQYTDLQQQVIYRGTERLGQISSAVTSQAIVLVDIILLPAYRNQGIGTRLITDLQEKSREISKEMRLHVLQHNPAQHLYARLGFQMDGERFPYLSMVWNDR
ncbi:GNAT family N-acetyltransferase [Paenibacillus hexagrammi]|uniref:GNAT family N-acetyltransferase n=1 Tax=Paenibacillus hexagrammi TaxID=2908839 RepID=A0ABY3SIN6_9BACL|nr:GNAT family N-acetyltransferase [Paenibacillus sp. YPD9-1]UJF33806.1 GNAT family N-acetyltransferase [Paenibacillus sp. YPD9-1]